MLASVGVHYSLVGHSERRTVFKDSDSDINQSLLQVLANGMVPILCVGETLEEYQLSVNQEVCILHLSKGLKGVTAEVMEKIVIAYEPVWAIGTGLTATPEIGQCSSLILPLIRHYYYSCFMFSSAFSSVCSCHYSGLDKEGLQRRHCF